VAKQTKRLIHVGDLVQSIYNVLWIGQVMRIYGDGSQILADIKITDCLDKRGLGHILTQPLNKIAKIN